jgi:DNA sulfur modification protein DndC
LPNDLDSNGNGSRTNIVIRCSGIMISPPTSGSRRFVSGQKRSHLNSLRNALHYEGGKRVKKRAENNPHLYATNLYGKERKPYEWSYHKTIEDLHGYNSSLHWVVAYSGGKDSTTVATLVFDAIEKGLIAPPWSLTVMYADTGMEVPPLHQAALDTLNTLANAGVKTHVVRPELEKRFFVYMLGRGVPPPSNTFRWCTGKLKLEPMTQVLKAAHAQFGERFLLLTGVRDHESAARSERLALACSRNGAECGQGMLYVDATANRIADVAVPILHWRVCHVWDWLFFHAPARFAASTSIVAEVYGGDEAREKNARTGCMMCPLVSDDYMMDYVCSLPRYAYLAPVKRLRSLYAWMKLPHNRLRRRARHDDYPLGPLTMSARRTALAEVLAIQEEVNETAHKTGRSEISLINQEEHQRILELIKANTWPQNWTGNELRGDEIYTRDGVTPLVLPLLRESEGGA